MELSLQGAKVPVTDIYDPTCGSVPCNGVVAFACPFIGSHVSARCTLEWEEPIRSPVPFAVTGVEYRTKTRNCVDSNPSPGSCTSQSKSLGIVTKKPLDRYRNKINTHNKQINKTY